MRITHFDCQKIRNTIIKGKIHVYDKPRWRISFDLPESALAGLLKRTLDERENFKIPDLIDGLDAQNLGITILKRLFSPFGEHKGGYAGYLLKVIQWNRKQKKRGAEEET